MSTITATTTTTAPADTSFDALAILSQLLGYCVIAGSALFQLPQIYTILTKHTAEGISLTAYLVEMLMFCTSAAWGIAYELPLATYGENILIVLQVGIVLLLIGWYQRRMPAAGGGTAVLVTLMLLMASHTTPEWVLTFLYASQVVNTILAKAPQVALNHRRRGTGALNVFTVLLMFVGATTRVFTTAVEVSWEKGKGIMLAGFSCAMVLNGIMLSQFFLYKKLQPHRTPPNEAGEEAVKEIGGEPVGQEAASCDMIKNSKKSCGNSPASHTTVKSGRDVSLSPLSSVTECELQCDSQTYLQAPVIMNILVPIPTGGLAAIQSHECDRHEDVEAERSLPISRGSSRHPSPTLYRSPLSR